MATPLPAPAAQAQGDRVSALLAVLETVSGYRGVTALELEEFATWSDDPGLKALGLELQLAQLPPTEARAYALEQVRGAWLQEQLVAATYLARSADPDTLVTLRRMSEDEDPENSWAPAVALALTGDDAPLWRWANLVTTSYAQASPPLTWLGLGDLVREAVLWEHPATLSVLGAFSRHPDESVRREVAEGLALHRSSQTDRILEGLAQDPSDRVRDYASVLTARHGDTLSSDPATR